MRLSRAHSSIRPIASALITNPPLDHERRPGIAGVLADGKRHIQADKQRGIKTTTKTVFIPGISNINRRLIRLKLPLLPYKSEFASGVA